MPFSQQISRGVRKQTGPTGSRWGIKRRSVLSAVVVVGTALMAGAVLLLWLLQSALISTATTNLESRAADIASSITELDGRGAQSVLTDDRRPGELSQVLDASGTVIAWSAGRLKDQPLSALRPADGVAQTERLAELSHLEDPDSYLLVARGLVVDGNSYTVMVAGPVQVQADTVRTVALFLVGATPAILIVVGVAVWVLVGRSLSTVERIREQVAGIDSRRLSDRVDIPPTGDEIARLATTMNTMLQRLDTSDTALRAFFSDASHELRSPLSTLVTSAEIARTDPTGQTWLDLQPTILSEVTRIQSLVEDLLTLAKADSQVLVDKRLEVDLEEILDLEIRRLRTVTRHRVIAAIDPARVIGDEGRLTQVIRNLLDNAARHAVSTVRVGCRPGDGLVYLDVDNDGRPVAEDQRERIFERFVRLEESRTRDGGGSGLGLAIAAEIVHAHDGRISTTVSPDGWCRFSVLLPLHRW